jgi:hypothetical protein
MQWVEGRRQRELTKESLVKIILQGIQMCAVSKEERKMIDIPADIAH